MRRYGTSDNHCGILSKRGVKLSHEEVFVSSGASDELGDILDLFGKEKTVLIMEPAYPAYVDANVIAGNTIIHIPAGEENGFVPVPDPDIAADVIYICSPNNPTGAVFDREALQAWVDYANKMNAIILFDAAYEAFIEEDDIPHSIFLKSRKREPVPLKFALCLRPRALQEHAADIQSFQKNCFAAE